MATEVAVFWDGTQLVIRGVPARYPRSLTVVSGATGADLLAIEALTGTGGLFRTGTNTWALRTLTAPAAGLTIANPAGVAGNPTFALANDLAALEALTGTGSPRRTGVDTWTLDEEQTGICTPGVNTTDGTTGTSTGVAFTGLTAGATYRLSGHLGCTSASAVTAPQFALVRSGGCTLTYESLLAEVATSGIASQATSTTSTTDGFTAGTAGPAGTEEPVVLSGMVIINAGGTLTLQLRSGVGASIVTIVRGWARLERIS